MHVIFNADDFGLTPGVNKGIATSCLQGVVRSTTMMVAMEGEQHGLGVLPNAPSLAVGLHMRLTSGKPLTAGQSLVDKDGEFFGYDQYWDNQAFKQEEIYAEACAQVEHFLSNGLSLSHIDGHHHAHTHPKVLPVIEEVAAKYKVPLRGSQELGINSKQLRYSFSDKFYGGDVSLENALHIVKSHLGSTDVLEIMCHPAFVDPPLTRMSSYTALREKELSILTSPVLMEQFDELGVILGNYSILNQ